VWIAAAAGALAILALGTILWIRRGREQVTGGALGTTSIGMASAIVPTSSPTVQTPSPTVPPTVKPSSTTRPTPTSTPPPAWVTDFAEPILASIAGREPDFQDDFSTKAGGWEMVWPWVCSEMKYVDAELVLSECKMRRSMWYTDFVAEMDARFLTDSHAEAGQPDWDITFRCEDPTCSNGNAYKLEFYFDGGVRASVRVFGSDQIWPSIGNTPLSGASRAGLNTNHILVIVKDQEIALLVNGQPSLRVEVEPRWLNGGMAWGANGAVAFDNIRIWDISDISLAPTP
jgi:hypothetical protein